jgi:hypothetical protein
MPPEFFMRHFLFYYDKGILFQSLHHSFATHLPEKSVDIKYIKEQLANIESPLDCLLSKYEI